MKNIVKSLSIFCIFLFGVTSGVSAENGHAGKVHKYSWNGIEVTWLEDESFPTYDVMFYFADGALSDGYHHYGETEAAFNMLQSGTRRFNQKEINDNLEFYGADYDSNVTHEYSTYKVSGLVKDIMPTMKMICHMFRDANYPRKEVVKERNRGIDLYRGLVANHGELARMAFRELSLKGTPFSYPVSGKMSDFKRITKKRLKSKLNYFNHKVKKRIYLTGPKKVLSIKKIIERDCAWKGDSKDFTRSVGYKKQNTKIKLYFVPVPKANQARVFVGRFLNKGEFDNSEELDLASSFLGGGFTSKLMREIRVKRGLTYSVSAFAAGQRDYGRAIIQTFTKNSSVVELINVIKKTLDDVSKGSFTDEEFLRARGKLAGSYPFKLEKTDMYLSQLLFQDHIGKSYDEIYNFPKVVSEINREKVSSMTSKIFGWDKQTILVLGDKSLLRELKKIRPVEVVSYKKFIK